MRARMMAVGIGVVAAGVLGGCSCEVGTSLSFMHEYYDNWNEGAAGGLLLCSRDDYSVRIRRTGDAPSSWRFQGGDLDRGPTSHVREYEDPANGTHEYEARIACETSWWIFSGSDSDRATGSVEVMEEGMRTWSAAGGPANYAATLSDRVFTRTFGVESIAIHWKPFGVIVAEGEPPYGLSESDVLGGYFLVRYYAPGNEAGPPDAKFEYRLTMLDQAMPIPAEAIAEGSRFMLPGTYTFELGGVSTTLPTSGRPLDFTLEFACDRD